MQALILAGGEGTRLRPLTSSIPKPVVPLVDRPFITYMIEWLRGHGVDDVILACGFMAEGVRAVLGDGSSLGVSLRYVEEPTPLGTGGALKYAEELLDERFFMLNGDVLTDMDLTAQLAQHQATGARATIALMPVDDPSAYGLVRLKDDCSVRQFVEKPSPEEIDTNLVNAGSYVLERNVLDGLAPAGTKISIERDVFPALVGHGLYGYEAGGYWMDIGTPERYLQATYEIMEGDVQTEIGRRLAAAGGVLIHGNGGGAGGSGGGGAGGGGVAGTLHPPVLVADGCRIAPGATIGGRTVLGRGVTIGEGAHIDGSVLHEGASVGAGSRVSASIIGPEAQIGDHCRVEGRVILGRGVRVGAGNTLLSGIRVFPGVELPDGAIAF